ncbi:MAG: hypothetical protein C0501_03430 [Isosphaera sp.]|nr:hypothetical protein [Isosphaera sp.]
MPRVQQRNLIFCCTDSYPTATVVSRTEFAVAHILLIDDEPEFADCLREELEAHGHAVEYLPRAEEGVNRLAGGRFDLVLLDNIMPRMTGLEFLDALRARGVATPVVLITGESSSDTAIRAINLGAHAYVLKDEARALARELGPVIEQALEVARPVEEVLPGGPPAAAATGLVLVGKSKPMLQVYTLIGQFADAAMPVLIHGETGTGKELVARALHTNSRRKDRPYVALNCTTIQENMMASELFGHEKGAFTGADRTRKGKLEYADGGTLFLDEIGDMPLHLQTQLLRVLEYQRFERLGGEKEIGVNFRLLSATHRDLGALVAEGRFREDLMNRLGRPLRLPSLRERLTDIPDLVTYFLKRAAEATGRSRPSITPEALDRLREHPWPGNVRELQNVVFGAFALCRGPQILPRHIEFQSGAAARGAGEGDGPAATDADAVAALRKAIAWAWDTDQKDLWPLLRDMLERELLRTALGRLRGNKEHVAERLGIVSNTVRKRMDQYGLG